MWVETPERRVRIGAAACLLLSLTAGCGSGGERLGGSGTIEFDEVDVSSLVGGRVIELFADESDTVLAGDTLAVLEQPEVSSAVALRAAELAQAEAVWRDLVAGPRRQEIETAVAEMEAAEAELESAEAELRRVEGLLANKLISELEVDQARAARDAATARRSAAQEQLALVRAGTRPGQIMAARRGAEAARARYEAAVELAEELIVRSPIVGVVLVRTVERGEVVGAGVPLFTLGNPDSLWIRVYVSAPELVGVRLGSPAQVKVGGLPDRVFSGRVVEIATRAEFTPRAALTEEERANIVFGVKIALEPTGGVLKPGIPADAYIEAYRGELSAETR